MSYPTGIAGVVGILDRIMIKSWEMISDEWIKVT